MTRGKNPKPHDMTHSIESAPLMFLTKRIIGDKKDPYLIRYIIAQTPVFSLYVHKLVRSDYERALHDHPWPFLSLVLVPYAEEFFTPYGRLGIRMERVDAIKYNSPIKGGKVIEATHRSLDILFRPGSWRHRVIIRDRKKPGWTIVLTGPRTRKWGFWPKGIWCHWKRFNEKMGICESLPIAGRTGLD